MTEPPPAGPPVEPSPLTARVLGGVEVVALASMVARGLWAWGIGLRTRTFDYDEVTRAHSIWMASRGLRPYGDFFESHPPYFALLTPLVRISSDPYDTLLTLRVFASAGNLLFLGGLAALGSSIGGGRRWAWLGLAFVAFHPAILDYLVEFRVDGWGYAAATWSLWRFRRLPRGPYRDFEVALLTGSVTLLLCPKLALLPPLMALFDLLGVREPIRAKLRAGLAFAAGTGLAAGLFALYLAWQGIDFRRLAQLVGEFNVIVNEKLGYRLGLLASIRANESLNWAILAGVVGSGATHLRHRTWPDPYEAALGCWLVLQALLVAAPFKQYYAPWYLFASGFLACVGRGAADLAGLAGLALAWASPRLARPRASRPSARPSSASTGALGRLRARLNRGSPDLVPIVRAYLARRPEDLPGLLAAAVFVASAASVGPEVLRTARGWAEGDAAGSQGRVLRWMDRVTRPGDRIVTAPPLHPIDRLDTFFLWINASSPAGYDAGRILEQLSEYRRTVGEARFREELEAHPPALVLQPGSTSVPYTAGQKAALAEFLAKRDYRAARQGPAEFAIRPDRHEEARALGLIDGGP